MSNNERYQYLIDQYKLGKLSQAELQEIADLRLTDTKFQELYDAEVLLHESFRLNDLEGKLSELKELEDELEEDAKEADLISRAANLNVLREHKNDLKEIEQELKKPEKTSFSRRQWLSIAASFLVLISAVWWVNQPTAAERYFEEHFVPDDQPFTVRDAREDLLQKCYTHYDKWEWSEAIECILELKKIDDDPRHDYYLGICYLGNKEWEKAQTIFQRINHKNRQDYLNLILNSKE